MSSLMWYIYDFARKAWAQGFANAKTSPEIVEKPSRFRNFPNVIKEYCIGCGACISSCPSPNAIKLVRDEDDETKEGVTYPIINKSACIRCGFCAEVCPTEPKTLECGENHLLKPEFNIIPSKRQFIIDDYLCVDGLRKLVEVHDYPFKNGKELAQAAYLGDVIASEIYYTFGQMIGEALKPFVREFEPQEMVFGGQISQSLSLFEDGIKQVLAPYTPSLRRSADSTSATLYGLKKIIEKQLEETKQ